MFSKKLVLPLASLSLALGACSSNIVTSAADVAETIGEIKPSRNDTCETKRQVAVQTSKIRTIKEGREVVVKAPSCATG